MSNEVKKKLDKIQEIEEERVARLISEEKAEVKRFQKDNQVAEESLPPVIMDDVYGNKTPHILINGTYVVKPKADVLIQEKLLVVEYQKLEFLKKQFEIFKRTSKNSK